MTDLGSGQLRVLQGRYSDAAPFFRDALIAYERVGFLHYLAQTIEGAAYVAHSRGESRAAVTLIAAASVMRDRTGHQPTQKIGAFHESVLAKLRQTLGEASFEDAWQEGRAFRRGEAGRRALAALADAPTPR